MSQAKARLKAKGEGEGDAEGEGDDVDREGEVGVRLQHALEVLLQVAPQRDNAFRNGSGEPAGEVVDQAWVEGHGEAGSEQRAADSVRDCAPA